MTDPDPRVPAPRPPGAGEPEQPVPDDKDWTFVITEGCPECGFIPFDARHTGARLRATIEPWVDAVTRDDAGVRPRPDVWSPLEYGAHVVDVLDVFGQRLVLMLSQDDPRFPNWDQDAAAINGRYDEADAREVAEAYRLHAEALADAWDAVSDDQWQRTGVRSHGSPFTVATLGVYFIHDLEHHLHDVGAR